MKRKLPVILLLSLFLLILWQIADSGLAQQKPLTLAQVLTGLQTRGRTAETNTLAKRNVYIAKLVRQVGVTFQLTPVIEDELRITGATEDLIEAIRQNSPVPTPTPSPRRTPDENSNRPINVGIQTPTPRPTPSVSAKEIKNSIGMEFVKIPAGSFMMGSPASEKDRYDDEGPQHQVTISRDFYMGKYEVTQGQWKAVMGTNTNPSNFKGDNLPVESVSWEDAQEFIKKLNGKGEGTYRLPREAEWEYAARGGTTTAFAFGDSLSSEQANFDGNYPYGNAGKGKYLGKTTEVGSYRANGWGLYDMHGNVWEWCEDWYDSGYYAKSPGTDPTGAASGSIRVFRGGSWGNYGGYLRSAFRYNSTPSVRSSLLGFRLIRE